MKKVNKITFLGLFTAMALILSFLETLIPNIVPIPGFKIGLANFAVLMALYLYGFKEALIVDLVRILLSAIIKKTYKFSPVGVSVFGAIFHNLGQFLLAGFIIRSLGIFYYLPFTLIFCILTGFFNGYLVTILKDRLKNIKK